MADAVSKSGRCDALAGEDLQALCMKTFTACEGFADEAVRDYCRAQTEGCATQAAAGKDAYVMQTFDGVDINAISAPFCFGLTRRASEGARPGQRKAPVDAALVAAPKADAASTPASPPVAPVAPEAEAVPAYRKCEQAGDPGTPGNARCRELIDQCLAGATQLVTEGQPIAVLSSESCLSLAARIAIHEFGAPPAKPAPAEAPAAEAVAEDWVSDGKRRFDRRIRETRLFKGFAPGAGTVELDLHIPYDNDRYSIPIRIAYEATDLGGGRSRVTYTITDEDGAALGAPRTIEVALTKGVVPDDLAFGITLEAEGNFARVAAIAIVKLK